MRIGYLSDLHLEFYTEDLNKFGQETLELLNSQKVDKLIIAGDLHSNYKKRKKFLESLTVPFLFVEGNHDYKKEYVSDNTKDLDGIISTTLWTNFQNNDDAKKEVSQWWDYRWINNWTIEKTVELFNQQVEAIFWSDSEIVVTHFAPSMKSVEEKYKDSGVENYYFCNDLDERIKNSNKKLWIHGHVHSQHDYMIGDCRVVANPWGYPNECKYQKEVKIIEIKGN